MATLPNAPFPATPPTTTPPDAVDLAFPHLTETLWDKAEIVLVADRSRGSTHSFFRNWRVEVVAGPDEAEPGRCLFTAPISSHELAASGWRYNLVRLEDRPGFASGDTATFSWAAKTADASPNPFALAHDQARSWLLEHGQ